MEYRVLGKTGLKISRLGFGGIPIQRILYLPVCECECVCVCLWVCVFLSVCLDHICL